MPDTSDDGSSSSPPLRRVVEEARSRVDPDGTDNAHVVEWIAQVVAFSPRIALSKTEAAHSLGVSVEFFDAHVAPEVRVVRRGRRRLYPLGELLHWLWRASDPPAPRSADAPTATRPDSPD